ncbi:Dolichyl-diphosphooligosaccharide-protein glycosyltransferase subunit dad1 [Coemansia interrupta]|uniref:Dolichyl-diphosphooligosaccharide--protein glycosyltransferase subunit OST2 n=1 Tax=Coemansia interrupta TaxID=1126814 RepID=A0A9W8LPH4_9FUNG|nr:Dolichyl-diphosphooligosaccharide-protein glycosyltransferase subunit dad1 [Coemansia interrupta]
MASQKQTQTQTDTQAVALRSLARRYTAQTPRRLRVIDAYMAFCVAVGVVQFVYCAAAGSFPYNAFLAGFGSAVACFVFAANLRMKTDPQNRQQFPGSSAEGAFGEFVFCHVVLHFVVANFLG